MRHWLRSREGGPWRLDARVRSLDWYTDLLSRFTTILEAVSISWMSRGSGCFLSCQASIVGARIWHGPSHLAVGVVSIATFFVHSLIRFACFDPPWSASHLSLS